MKNLKKRLKGIFAWTIVSVYCLICAILMITLFIVTLPNSLYFIIAAGLLFWAVLHLDNKGVF